VLNQFLNSIADAGRDLWQRRSGNGRRSPDALRGLCDDLLSTRGEASGIAVARDVARTYDTLDETDRLALFRILNDEFAADADAINAAADAYRDGGDLDTFLALARSVEPPRQEFFRRLNMAPGGTRTIVSMRAHLLGLLRDHPELKAVDADLRHLLGSWFNRGFLTLERIDWHTPADILERLIQYEAVHRMDGWDDLRRRLDRDRRCFAFFHPALPGEPLIFVEVALVNGLATSVQPLLDRSGEPDDPAGADTAIFYSISNCQEGLAGISFGNFLIKQVVHELARELPGLKVFSTLSPIPGLRRWLAEQADLTEPEREAAGRLDNPDWQHNEALAQAVRPVLMRLCARYLVDAKRGDRPADPVARFHLGNGARLEQINWMGDSSANGIAQSAGMLCNYLYDLKTIERNHEAYANSGRVTVSSQVKKLLG
jgi:malonyl-CoA decarboxylase